MVHPFFDELRDPNIKLPDSRHANGAPKDMPNLFEFTHHGMLHFTHFTHFTNMATNTIFPELSIAPQLNHQLVPAYMKPILAAKGLDIDNLQPLTREQMAARLD